MDESKEKLRLIAYNKDGVRVMDAALIVAVKEEIEAALVRSRVKKAGSAKAEKLGLLIYRGVD